MKLIIFKGRIWIGNGIKWRKKISVSYFLRSYLLQYLVTILGAMSFYWILVTENEKQDSPQTKWIN